MLLRGGHTYFTTKECASITNRTCRAIRHWVEKGYLKDSIRTGVHGRIHIKGSELLRYLYTERFHPDQRAVSLCIEALRVGEVDRRLLYHYTVGDGDISPEDVLTYH